MASTYRAFVEEFVRWRDAECGSWRAKIMVRVWVGGCLAVLVYAMVK
jgi:hypothetical protein